MAIAQNQREKAPPEVVYHIAEGDPSEVQHRIDHAFDILFESALADMQATPQTI